MLLNRRRTYMYYCPNCNKKYDSQEDNQEDTCVYCGTSLEIDTNQVEFLFTASNINEAVLIEDILESNNITSIRKYQSSGEYLTLYMGFSNLGIDIYVLASDFEPATLALSNSFPKYNSLITNNEIDSDDKTNEKRLLKKVLLFSILSPIILYIAIYFIINIL